MLEIIMLFAFAAGLGLTINNFIDWVVRRVSKRYFLAWYMGNEADGSVAVSTKWGKFLNLKDLKSYISDLGEGNVMITDIKEITKSDYKEWIRDLIIIPVDEKKPNIKVSEDIHISDEDMKIIVYHQMNKKNKPN